MKMLPQWPFQEDRYDVGPSLCVVSGDLSGSVSSGECGRIRDAYVSVGGPSVRVLQPQGVSPKTSVIDN